MNRLRVLWKSLLRRVRCIPAYCRDCGRDVRDFIAPAEVWARVWGGPGGVLCYDCFCERCGETGLPAVWRLGARFYSEGGLTGMRIIVNGRETDAASPLTYEAAVAAGFWRDGDSVTYATRRRGDSGRAGILQSGQSVDLEEGMRFASAFTGNA